MTAQLSTLLRVGTKVIYTCWHHDDASESATDCLATVQSVEPSLTIELESGSVIVAHRAQLAIVD